jgi:hypothetical protein
MNGLRLSRFVGFLVVAAVLGSTLGLPTDANASITFTGSDSTHSASATFDVSGTNLVVTLSNLYSNGNFQFVQTDVLTAVYFNVNGKPTLATVSANVPASSTIWHPDGTNVGQNWQYLQNNSGLGSTVTQDYGISSTGLGIFGPSGNFSSNGQHLDGGGWGLMPQTTANFGHAQFDTTPFVQSTAVFKLSGFGSNLLSDIGNVEFQYGTSLTETSFSGTSGVGPNDGTVPEPTTLVIWSLLAGLAIAIGGWRQSRAG